jgi:Carbohydrate-selective porin, OprB family
MWRYPQISALFHEVPCIKLLVATDGHNRIDEQVTAGFRYNGPIPHRAQDSVAFGMVYSKISDHFNQSYLPQSLPVLGAEKAFEVIRSKLFVRGRALGRLAAGGAILGGGWSQSASRECRRCRIPIEGYILTANSCRRTNSREKSRGSSAKD